MQLRQLCITLLITTSFGASSAAFAGYTVIDDDLFPSSRVEPTRYAPRSEVIRAAIERPRPVHGTEDHRYAVPFSKYFSALTPEGRAKLDELVPDMMNAKVRLVGRPDAIYYSTGQLQPLANNRAQVMRNYLLRQGVPAANITVEVDTTPNPQPNGASYPSDIYISYSRQAPRTEELSYVPQDRYQGATAQPTRSPAVSGVNSAKEQKLLQYIYQAVQAGHIHPATAVKLIQEILGSNPSDAVTPQPVSYQPQQPVASTYVPQEISVAGQTNIKPIPALTQQWVLDKRLTLKDNIDAWSKAAGWNPTQWDASNFYQVTTTTSLDGGFPDVLRQVADSTGLNICAKVREKYVRVTDSNISCK